MGAFHTAGQLRWASSDPYRYREQLEELQTENAETLRQELEESIKANEQARACAFVHRYGDLNGPVRPLLDILLKYAVSEDGALHAEKFYQTALEEYSTTRPAFRWRQIIALARVTASEYGHPAPGYQEARELLKLA